MSDRSKVQSVNENEKNTNAPVYNDDDPTITYPINHIMPKMNEGPNEFTDVPIGKKIRRKKRTRTVIEEEIEVTTTSGDENGEESEVEEIYLFFGKAPVEDYGGPGKKVFWSHEIVLICIFFAVVTQAILIFLIHMNSSSGVSFIMNLNVYALGGLALILFIFYIIRIFSYKSQYRYALSITYVFLFLAIYIISIVQSLTVPVIVFKQSIEDFATLFSSLSDYIKTLIVITIIVASLVFIISSISAVVFFISNYINSNSSNRSRSAGIKWHFEAVLFVLFVLSVIQAILILLLHLTSGNLTIMNLNGFILIILVISILFIYVFKVFGRFKKILMPSWMVYFYLFIISYSICNVEASTVPIMVFKQSLESFFTLFGSLPWYIRIILVVSTIIAVSVVIVATILATILFLRYHDKKVYRVIKERKKPKQKRMILPPQTNYNGYSIVPTKSVQFQPKVQTQPHYKQVPKYVPPPPSQSRNFGIYNRSQFETKRGVGNPRGVTNFNVGGGRFIPVGTSTHNRGFK